MTTYRVIQWGTGQVGTAALRSIIDDANLELAGLRVYSEDKEGRDAGELAERPVTGVLATRDADALIALNADCVCFNASEMFGPEQVVDEMCRILASGTNMVGTTITQLTYPDLLPEIRDRIADACRQGGSSFHWNGINPGFALDLIPALAATGVRGVDRIEVTEYLDISRYTDAIVRDVMGFGRSPEAAAQGDEMLVAMLKIWFGAVARLLAEHLDVTLEADAARIEKAVATESFDVHGLTVEAGTQSAVAFHCDYLVDGRRRITLHELFRVAPDSTTPWPEGWPQPPGGYGGYRVRFDGRPNVELEMSFPVVDGSDPMVDALIFTGQRVVALIPALCQAQPGIRTTADLGLIFGKVDW